MRHAIIDQILSRADRAKNESDDFTYFFSLLGTGEALIKTITLGMVAAIMDDADRNRYRLEHELVRSDGLGKWSAVLEDALVGPASHFLLQEVRKEQTELTRLCKENDWQYKSVLKIKETLDILDITVDEIPNKSDLRRWIRLFCTLRNKTRGHGATRPSDAGEAANPLSESINIVYDNFSIFQRSWAYLYRNFSGKYRVSLLGNDNEDFNFLKREKNHKFKNGIYIYFGEPKPVPLIVSNPDLNDFFIANGSFNDNSFELLSYNTDNREKKDSSFYLTPPGPLPESETKGFEELKFMGNCFSNIPKPIDNYIERRDLEKELFELLIEDRRLIVTLRGMGGIGKTSLTLQVIEKLSRENRYSGIIWFSARDIDLLYNKTKQVRPDVFSQEDVAKYYARLLEKNVEDNSFDCKKFFEKELESSESFNNDGCLFIFDNFETVQNPLEMFQWIDSYIRSPNKILITTRLSDFKGDYPIEVEGMIEEESRKLIKKTASSLQTEELLTPNIVNKIISQSKGHPYVIKILVGELKKNKNIREILSKREDVLTALFERTYSSLSPCEQRAFMTLASVNSEIPKITLEAVLICSLHQELGIVDDAIESLFRYSLLQKNKTEDGQEFISLPAVAKIFGKNKLKISSLKSDIEKDVKLLKMFGPSQSGDLSLNFAKQLEKFIKNIARQIDDNKKSFEHYEEILNVICQTYNDGRLLLARFHKEQEKWEKSKKELKLFLENASNESSKEGWKMLSEIYLKLEDYKGYIHTIIELSKMNAIPFYDMSNAANTLNSLFANQYQIFNKDDKRTLAEPLLDCLEKRKSEAKADDFSRMAWLSLHVNNQEERARSYVDEGLKDDPNNSYCLKLKDKLNKSAVTTPY